MVTCRNGTTATVLRKMGLAEFSAWVGSVLEAASYRPSHPVHAHVVILPLSQMLGVPFAAVLPGM